MSLSLVQNNNQDPNKTKNRIPTDRERQFLAKAIENDEKRLSHIDGELKALHIQVADSQCAVQEYESAILIADDLFKCTKAVFNAMQSISPEFASLSERSQSWPPPEASPRALYDNILEDSCKLERKHVEDLLVAQDDFKRAIDRIYELKEELDATRSILAFTKRSMLLLLDLKSHIQNELHLKEDLIGARRRIPAELWAEIFHQTLERDEHEFQMCNRNGSPPFTTLRLSWVCKFWRTVAQSQPILWRYIAIPRAIELSPSQRDRINFYFSSTKACSPIVYIAPGSRGVPGSTISMHVPLLRFHQLAKLELRVSRRTTETEDLLAAAEPTVEELVLIGTSRAGTIGTSCPLKYSAISNIQTITCIHVQPFMRNSSPNDMSMHLKSAKFVQTGLDTRRIIQFLEALPTIECLQVDLTSGFSVEGENPRPSAKLPGIKRVSATLEVLCALFPQEIALPNLEHVVVHSYSGDARDDWEIPWKAFLSIHSRDSGIRSLTLGTLSFPSTGIDVPEMYARMILLLPHLQSLRLIDEAAPYALEGMVLTKSIPTTLQSVSLCSDTVKEDHITSFLRFFHASRKGHLELRVVDCPGVSEESRRWLAKLSAS